MDVQTLNRIRSWMFTDALPFWADIGIDRQHGGCVEILTLDGLAPVRMPYKRARLISSQLYVFSHASLLGWTEARAIADHLYDVLVTKFWRGPDEGWARSLTADLRVLDATPDLSVYAFALFALGWRYKAAGDAGALQLAHATLDLLERRLKHPEFGFHNQEPPTRPRQQGPHLHLIEGAVAIAEAAGDARFARLVDELADVFYGYLVKQPTGVVPEAFEDDWRAAHGDGGRVVEPGCCFEWAFSLARCQNVSGRDHAAAVRNLVGWADRHGVETATGRPFNSVSDNGRPLDRGVRLWARAERLKGWIAHFELSGADPRAAIASSCAGLLDEHIGRAPRGGWIDAFSAAGAPTIEVVPASSLYRLFLAFSELLRIAPALALGAPAQGSA